MTNRIPATIKKGIPSMIAGIRARKVLSRGLDDFLSPKAQITDSDEASMKGNPNAIMS